LAGRFDNSIISQVQQANDIVDVISEHLSLKKKGREMVGLCPFHDDHSPSLSVSPVKQIFKCFSCGVGGDVLKFVQLAEGLTFPQAVERLAQRAGIKLKTDFRRPSPRADSTEPDSDADPQQLARANKWAAGYWQRNLKADTKSAESVRKYIAERKIKPESVKKWALGFAPDNWESLLTAAKRARIPVKLLVQAGLVVPRDAGEGFYDKFRNRLMFPITDVTGRIIGFGGRTLGDDPAKYMNSPATALFDKSRTVYGLGQAREAIVSSGSAVVVEGYTDCIMAHQFGCGNVVATLGTSFTEMQARVLGRYAREVIFVFDSDQAGIAAANRALEVCLGQCMDIKITSVPEGKDPCDFLLSAGAEAFKDLLTEAVDVMQFKWDLLLRNFNGGRTLREKRAAADEYLRSVATAIAGRNVDLVSEGLIVNRLSGIIGLTSQQINAKLASIRRQVERSVNRRRAGGAPFAVDLGTGFFAGAQREIIEILLNKPEFFDRVQGQITAEMFDVPILRQIAGVLFEILGSGQRPCLKEILGTVESAETASVMTRLAEEGNKKQNFQFRLDKALEAISEHRRQCLRSETSQIEDEVESLRRFQSQLSSQNSRNPGMV